MFASHLKPCIDPRFDQALRWAALAHHGQVRRGSGVPYVQHVVAVAWGVERAGFDDEVVVAALLHDLVEDTDATLQEVAARFGPRVAELVGHCSETKLDAEGRQRPWLDRKRDHLAALADAPVEAKGIILADKLHNLMSIRLDLDEGREVWSGFHAERSLVLWYYEASIAACRTGDPRLERLATQAKAALESLGPAGPAAV